MQRIIISIWLLLYLVPANGISVQLHYCLGSLKSVEVFPVAEKSCGCSSKWKCCEYTYISAKLNSEYQQAREFSLDKQEEVPQPIEYGWMEAESCFPLLEQGLAENVEPPPPLLPVYLACSSLIFYG